MNGRVGKAGLYREKVPQAGSIFELVLLKFARELRF